MLCMLLGRSIDYGRSATIVRGYNSLEKGKKRVDSNEKDSTQLSCKRSSYVYNVEYFVSFALFGHIGGRNKRRQRRKTEEGRKKKQEERMSSAKNLLQELLVKHGLQASYSSTGSGPEHSKVFSAVCVIGSRSFRGMGNSKKEAELESAADALRSLRADPTVLRSLCARPRPTDLRADGAHLVAAATAACVRPLLVLRRHTLIFVDVESSQDISVFEKVCYTNASIYASTSASTVSTMRDKIKTMNNLVCDGTGGQDDSRGMYIRELFSDSAMPNAADVRIIFEVGRMAGTAMGGDVIVVSNDNFATCLKTVLCGCGIVPLHFEFRVFKRCQDCIDFLASQST
eukprot:ANDGO_00813.mRNA.1 hypothetical protein